MRNATINWIDGGSSIYLALLAKKQAVQSLRESHLQPKEHSMAGFYVQY